MNNILIMNNKEYKLEKIWRPYKNSKLKDSKGVAYPYPQAGNIWADKENALEKLQLLNDYLDLTNKYDIYDDPKDCLLCDQKNIITKRYRYKNMMWEDGLTHYIDVHNIEPSFAFKELLYHTNLSKNIQNKKTKTNKKWKMLLKRVEKHDNIYVVITRNQLLILDALMIHGGYDKKYTDIYGDFINRYSEHSGFLDFDATKLNKIIVSSKTTRVDDDDNEIFLPMEMNDMYDYEYIFHSHPPTPSPGGRVSMGILYEFPSIGDIYHFIDHHNDGNVIGSLVVSSEGLYNIRKYKIDDDNINVDENSLYRKYQKTFYDIQKEAIKKYGNRFTTYEFYSKIAQDMKYINELNNTLNKYNIHIDFYPRKKSTKKLWYLDTIFLIFRHNKKS